MNGLFKITEHRGYAVIRCAPVFNDVFLGTSAYYDPDDRGWVISTRRLDELIAFLEDRGHDVIAERPNQRDRRVCPHGVLLATDSTPAYPPADAADAKSSTQTKTRPIPAAPAKLEPLLPTATNPENDSTVTSTGWLAVVALVLAVIALVLVLA